MNKSMEVVVKTGHKSEYPHPICFEAGDQLQIGHEDDQYPGWLLVKTSDENEGWAPKDYIAVDPGNSNSGVALCTYTAFELNTFQGEALQVLKELNGWYWVKNSQGLFGWVPSETVAIT